MTLRHNGREEQHVRAWVGGSTGAPQGVLRHLRMLSNCAVTLNTIIM